MNNMLGIEDVEVYIEVKGPLAKIKQGLLVLVNTTAPLTMWNRITWTLFACYQLSMIFGLTLYTLMEIGLGHLTLAAISATSMGKYNMPCNMVHHKGYPLLLQIMFCLHLSIKLYHFLAQWPWILISWHLTVTVTDKNSYKDLGKIRTGNLHPWSQKHLWNSWKDSCGNYGIGLQLGRKKG